MRNMWLLFCYTIQLIIIKLCTKFQNPNSSNAEKSLTKNVYMYYIRVKEGNNERNEKEGKMSFSIFIYIYTIHLAYI